MCLDTWFTTLLYLSIAQHPNINSLYFIVSNFGLEKVSYKNQKTKFLGFWSRGYTFPGATGEPSRKTCSKYDFQHSAIMDRIQQLSISFRLKKRSFIPNVKLVDLGINGYLFRIVHSKLTWPRNCWIAIFDVGCV